MTFDCREWKDVELWGDQFNLSENEEYTPEDIYDICKGLIDKAQEAGLKGCYLKFQSHMEPYEDWLGSPSVTPCGYRRFTLKEEQEHQEHDEDKSLAEEMNISVYEAAIIRNLKKRGKL